MSGIRTKLYACIFICSIVAGVFYTGKACAISFEEALKNVLAEHPLLKSFPERKKGILFQAYQEARFSNPELNLTFEDIFGTGEFSGIRSSETTLEVAQEIPIFGKRRKRFETILTEREILKAREEEARLNLFRETARAFTEALYARHKVKLYGELLELSRRLVEITQLKFQAGKIPETERIRAEILTGRIETGYVNALEEWKNSLVRLARLWRGNPPSKVEGDFFRGSELVARDSPYRVHPRIKEYKSRITRLRREIDLARREAWPDLKISAGIRWYNESDERAYLFGISFPLPFWNRNQDRIAALYKEISAVRMELEAESLELSRRLSDTASQLRQTRKEILTLETHLIPRAQEIYQRTLEAYRVGKAEFLRVLDTQRTLAELKLARLEAYRRYHLLRAEWLYLMAQTDPKFFK